MFIFTFSIKGPSKYRLCKNVVGINYDAYFSAVILTLVHMCNLLPNTMHVLEKHLVMLEKHICMFSGHKMKEVVCRFLFSEVF